ncbi:GNAT family N-acetyltransferase [Vibrio parahaemolyticus]|nr:GNAT family N-acetyltransferase [Vibrio parahaemolyticus]EJG0880208.1 GNAT family N-acetyltransferase [Vibrio parahaemolyticus]ELA9326146.1 GNAT family N-acetyltransferase [Vibrio parahaemolyticus]ELB2244912.1 GNAT family N-acetyltransferase [Vibrio parahaemolyticus]TOF46825.1 GNAT family N-acetyltransferase [Vibrio parahaemolyticus]
MSTRGNMEVYCKILKPQDSLKYRELRLESLRLYPEAFGSDYKTQSQLPKLFFEQMIEKESNDHIMLGAFYNNELVGLCGLISLEQSHSLEIVQMYVSPNARGKSIGQTLLTKAKSVLQDRNEDRLELTVYSGNFAAIKSYKKFGFIRVASQAKEIVMHFKL